MYMKGISITFRIICTDMIFTLKQMFIERVRHCSRSYSCERSPHGGGAVIQTVKQHFNKQKLNSGLN